MGGENEPAEVLAVLNALAPQSGAYLKLGDLASVGFCAELIRECGAAFGVLNAHYEASLKQNMQAFSAENLADFLAKIQVNASLLVALQRSARAYLQTRNSIQGSTKLCAQTLAQHLAQFLLSIPVPILDELN